ncbi:MAG: VWA domain-containing protein [Anaerolineae bacterium]|nr:VWA domain-containing protein [Anaerolineae bacterium]
MQAEDFDCISATVLLDNSGSMKKNDPQGLRFSGLRLFISLLDIGDQVGVISFATESTSLTEGLLTIQDNQNKRKLLDRLDNPPAEGYTDLESAFRLASQMQEQGGANLCQFAIVLLTDGKPETATVNPHYEQDIIEIAKTLGIPVWAIALTPSAQTPFLEKLIAETGGFIIPAKNSADLLEAYLGVFSQIKDRTVLHENLSTLVTALPVEIAPDLAPYIEKASFIISKPEHISVELLTPDKNTPDFLFEENASSYSVYTVAHPVGGEWMIKFSSEADAQAYLILNSRLRIKIISPQEFHQTGYPMRIAVQLLEETNSGELRKIIGTSSFSASITNPDGSQESLDYFYDDGTHGDQLAEDGNFTRLYKDTTQMGEYKIEVFGNKGSVQVNREMQTVAENFPKMIYEENSLAYEVVDSPLSLRVYFNGDVMRLNVGKIIALIQSPSGRESQIQMTASKDVFEGSFMPKESGAYRVRFWTENATYRGITYQPELEADFNVKIIRTLSVSSAKNTVSMRCFSKDYLIPLDLTLISTQTEKIKIGLSELPGNIISSTQLEISSGEYSEAVKISLASFPFSGQSYAGHLSIDTDQDLDIFPVSSVPVYLEIPPIWVRCRKPVLQVSWSLAAVLFITVVTARRIRQRNMPSLVAGTLRYWAEGANFSKIEEWDLTAFKKESLLIGSGKESDLCLKDAGLETKHAQINAEKADSGVVILLEPIANIRKGYHDLSAPLALAHGDSFQMGKHKFQFLSDTGE